MGRKLSLRTEYEVMRIALAVFNRRDLCGRRFLLWLRDCTLLWRLRGRERSSTVVFKFWSIVRSLPLHWCLGHRPRHCCWRIPLNWPSHLALCVTLRDLVVVVLH